MPDISIECAQPYGHQWDNKAATEALSTLLSQAMEHDHATSLVLLVDDCSYEDKSFDFDTYSDWLRSKDLSPDLVARESQIGAACDKLTASVDYEKLEPELADKLSCGDGRISQAYIAAWCLLRLGYLEDPIFDPRLRANRLINILPESFKPGEDESIKILNAAGYSDAAARIDYIFIPS